MNIQDYCDILNLEIRVKYYPNQGSRWSASFEGVETKDNKGSQFLTSSYGDGKTPFEAIDNYIREIKGKILVINAYSENRKEYEVPDNLSMFD